MKAALIPTWLQEFEKEAGYMPKQEEIGTTNYFELVCDKCGWPESRCKCNVDKREEIREGLISKVKSIRMWSKRSDDPLSAEDDAKDILNYLHSQGVVLKVKCPDCEWSQFGEEAVGMTPCYRCNSTGYIVESLIKEE